MRFANSLSLQVLFRSVRTRRVRLTAAIALALLAAATGIVAPLLVAKLITALGAHTGLTTTVIWLAATVIIGAVAGGWSAYLLSTVGERAVADVRVALVRHIVGCLSRPFGVSAAANCSRGSVTTPRSCARSPTPRSPACRWRP